ncbi:hypothetical protein GCM10023238_01130 [Streptomyces heliomycini]
MVLLMAGGLAADRRRGELTLLRARGGSLRGVAGRLLAETAVVAVPRGRPRPGGPPTSRSATPGRGTPWPPRARVALLGCLALPLRALAAHRSVRVHGAREDVASARTSRRRTVVEVTLLVLAVGAVVALRTRGTSDGTADGTTDSGDHLVSLAPVLVGTIAAFVLVRLYPLPLRGLARPARRLRGAVGHLSLARAGRASAPRYCPCWGC